MTKWSEGYQAEARGKAKTDCPYVGGMARRQWLLGFDQSAKEAFDIHSNFASTSPHDYAARGQ